MEIGIADPAVVSPAAGATHKFAKHLFEAILKRKGRTNGPPPYLRSNGEDAGSHTRYVTSRRAWTQS